MAYTAVLTIKNESFQKILNFDYQIYNQRSGPYKGEAGSAKPEGGELNVYMAANEGKVKTTLLMWLTKDEKLDGNITMGADERVIDFVDAYITSVSESFSQDMGMTIQLSIVANILKIGPDEAVGYDFAKGEEA